MANTHDLDLLRPPERGRLPPPEHVRPRLRFVDHCRHCHGIHFTYAEYLECSRAAMEQTQPET